MLILRKQEGVTLIELMIGIVIISLLLSMAAPSFSLWIQNTQVRTTAESILNGLQLARTEAVRHNANVSFNLTAASGVSWTVDCETVSASCPANLHQRSGSESGNARAGIATATGNLATPLAVGAGLPAGVTFDNFGRVLAANIGIDIARVDVTNAIRADARRMVILVTPGGQIRMCDPGVSLTISPQGCKI
jgi:type IV fimbrial biogenesis protein FimT